MARWQRKQGRRKKRWIAEHSSGRRFYQLLTGHAATGDYLCNKIASDRCWCCEGSERQPRHYPLVKCEVWKPQIKDLWKEVGTLCEWRHPRAAGFALFFEDERAMRAVLTFPRGTKVV